MTSIAIATEDELSEQVAVRLTEDVGLVASIKLRKNGNGYLRSSMHKFAAMADQQPVLVITDLDTMHTPSQLMGRWLNNLSKPRNLLFHVAVREVEAWLLADHTGIKKLLGGKIGKVTSEPELLSNPKASLLALAARAPRNLREDLVGERNSMAAQGLGYNAVLSEFVKNVWRPDEASERSPSLAALRIELETLSQRK